MAVGDSESLNYFDFMELFQEIVLLRDDQTLLLKGERLLSPVLFYLFYRKVDLTFLLEGRQHLCLA